MAYTITQKATTPNAAYTRLLYVVSGSTNTAKPQFQYVMDVYESGSTDLINELINFIRPTVMVKRQDLHLIIHLAVGTTITYTCLLVDLLR